MDTAPNRMPGFTAEASLYKTSERYSLVGALNGLADHKGEGAPSSVQPALSIYVDGRYFCEGYIDRFGNVRCFPLGRRGRELL